MCLYYTMKLLHKKNETQARYDRSAVSRKPTPIIHIDILKYIHIIYCRVNVDSEASQV